jgi:hypothetical protein
MLYPRRTVVLGSGWSRNTVWIKLLESDIHNFLAREPTILMLERGEFL